MQEILESETMTTVALASEKIIARNKIFRVAGPFLLSVLAFKCKVLFKSRQVSTNPSVPYCSSFSSLSPFLALRHPSPLIPFVFHSLSPHHPSPLPPSIRYPLSDLLLFLVAGLARSTAETPLGQEASFPDIQMRSNIIPGHRVPHGGATTPRFPRG